MTSSWPNYIETRTMYIMFWGILPQRYVYPNSRHSDRHRLDTYQTLLRRIDVKSMSIWWSLLSGYICIKLESVWQLCTCMSRGETFQKSFFREQVIWYKTYIIPYCRPTGYWASVKIDTISHTEYIYKTYLLYIEFVMNNHVLLMSITPYYWLMEHAMVEYDLWLRIQYLQWS